MRNYALGLSYLWATFGFAVVLFAFITSQVVDPCVTQLLENGVNKLGNCRDPLIEKNVLRIVDGTRLESNSEELQKASTVLVTDFRRTASFPQMWFLTLAYFVIAPLAIFRHIGDSPWTNARNKTTGFKQLIEQV